MSSTQDPNPPETNPGGGDGPNEVVRSDDDNAAGAEGRQDEGRGEGARPQGDAPKTASKGINPVQHSE